MSGQPPYPPAEGGYPPAEGGYIPPPQTGQAPPQTGLYPPPQAGQAPPQAGYPPSQAEYPPPQTGQAPPQAGYPPPQTGQVPLQAGYPPPQTAPAPQQAQNTTVVVQQPQAAVVTKGVHFGPSPMSYNCHICHTQQVTRVDYKSGALTCLIVLVIFLLGFLCCLFWPFCCVPLCISGTKDVYHTCPNCNNQVGVHKRIG
ncbi:lipopolysaccharide-induced tumor necrosis factor-alpha factor homolog [Dysidea avara]|uniref:lipopolysaccharide-induced tumor necrosis factor-alpha factor homolog n=1 Tax=Dysidea avara TaxID=196820 RepID=UPI0033299648